MATWTVRKNVLAVHFVTVVFAVILTTAKGTIVRNRLVCPDYQFYCRNSERCIIRPWFCDGEMDCPDGTDEKYCRRDTRPFSECPTWWTLCDDFNRCYPSRWKCDGREDCQDGSDEKNCPCNCNPATSVRSDCDLNDGQCSCKENYGGLQCDRCRVGYFNYPQCEYCSCVHTGCMEEICDNLSGKCLCKPGFGGQRCDRCAAGFFGYPNCQECGCNEVGSRSSVCDVNGRCQCVPKFGGPKCDVCSPGHYDFPNCHEFSIRSISGLAATERNLTQHFLKITRQQTRSINKWGTHVTRIAVALYLNDRQFFTPGNVTGQEIAYELSLQLLSKLALKKSIETNDLALFINALTVACIDPKDFFGINMVDELRKRVNNSNHTSPFIILTLCNAKDTMTRDDVLKLKQQYDAHFRPIWTDTQAMVVMALSCISSRSDVNLDERILGEMVSEVKRKQHKNGTIDNLKTTALVVQALLAAGNYRTDFDLNAAIKFILQDVRRTYPCVQDIYYILPIFNSMSLANISSDHCETLIKTDLEVISNLREYSDARIQVPVSIIIGDNMDFSRTWKIKVPSNYSLYQILEDIGNLEPAYKIQYSVSDGKPFVTAVSKFQDNTEEGLFWFIYTKPLSPTESPKRIEESPVDVGMKETDEITLWYRSGFWAGAQELIHQTKSTDASNQEIIK